MDFGAKHPLVPRAQGLLSKLRSLAALDGAEGESFLLRQKEKYGTPEWAFRIFVKWR